MGGNRFTPDGETDPQAGILVVRERGGGPPIALGIVCGVPPMVLQEDSTQLSADFPHYTRQHLAERFGDELAVLHYTGACGDQSPARSVRAFTFDEAERLGRSLGEVRLL